MTLSILTEADCTLILPWRNSPAVRQAMYTHHAISPEEHRACFARMQSDPGSRCYLYHDRANVPRGVVYFTSIDARQGTSFLGFYTSPEATPGTGMRIALDALDLAFAELGLDKLNAEVLVSNTMSLNFHKKVGFTEEGLFRDQHFDGVRRIDVIRLGMLANEWPQNHARLKARVAELDALTARRDAAPPHPRKIVILSDVDSWINAAVEDLQMDWTELGYSVHWTHQAKELPLADFCFCLSFGQLVSNDIRTQFRHTLVVHESDLPKGKGWSPLTWQIIEGCNRIPVTLFEAAEQVDSGTIYAQRWIEFEGHELVDELRAAQAEATLELCRWFVDTYPASAAQGREQAGEESFYHRRCPADSALDPEKTIAEQFNLLRVVDNERYPAFFTWRGRQYNITIKRPSQ